MGFFDRVLEGRLLVPVVLYGRPGCALCARMKAEIARARLSGAFSLTEVDVDLDPELQRRYGKALPVLWIAGRKAFQGHLTAAHFARRFAELAIEYHRARELSRGLAERR